MAVSGPILVGWQHSSICLRMIRGEKKNQREGGARERETEGERWRLADSCWKAEEGRVGGRGGGEGVPPSELLFCSKQGSDIGPSFLLKIFILRERLNLDEGCKEMEKLWNNIRNGTK